MRLPDPGAVLDKLVSSLRPGGWLVAEEADWHATVICHPPSATWTKVFGAATAAIEPAGQLTGGGPARWAYSPALVSARGRRPGS